MKNRGLKILALAMIGSALGLGIGFVQPSLQYIFFHIHGSHFELRNYRFEMANGWYVTDMADIDGSPAVALKKIDPLHPTICLSSMRIRYLNKTAHQEDIYTTPKLRKSWGTIVLFPLHTRKMSRLPSNEDVNDIGVATIADSPFFIEYGKLSALDDIMSVKRLP